MLFSSPVLLFSYFNCFYWLSWIFLQILVVMMQLVFTSFSVDDEDYEGFEYSLYGQLSEVRIVYLHRFIQEVIYI